MVTFDDIPLEVQEQIFLNLTPKDLNQCSRVCSKWHDIINSNQIWLRMCAIEGLTGKRFLDDDFSLMNNPTKQFSNEATFAPLCHWKSHFKRYKYVKRNWRVGYYVRSVFLFTPIYINEKFVVQHSKSDVIIWDICGKLLRFGSFKLVLPNLKIDDFLWAGDYIVYKQQQLIVCLKRGENSYKEVIQLKLEPARCSQVRNNCIKQKMTLRVTEKFLLVQEHTNTCVLSFYDPNKGKLIRKIDLHNALGNMSIYSNCLDVMDDKVFLAYRMSTNSYIVRYNFSHDTWETPLPLQTEAVELYLSKKFICAKLSPESRDSPVSFFQIWDHSISMNPMEEVSEFYASKHLPIVLTDDDKVIYHSRDEIKIHFLVEDFVQILSASRGVMKFSPVWDRYLLIMDETGIAVWDWKMDKKVNTPFRDNCCTTFYASETNIVVRRDDEKFYIISYW